MTEESQYYVSYELIAQIWRNFFTDQHKNFQLGARRILTIEEQDDRIVDKCNEL